ncbi:flippase-like domain-containing protein [Acetobacterium paludosum]|uniref:Phosphatidylglycerol lysyltransferase n=1 Tax=Acetobacterium paludosum TaxID=52693 RepID=A0A923I110_9FIRM|nr:lysylphosphatidylglycerol synthase transmembrane domain-containing protein [Acetobacterium paludosum]MBC3889721.1 flippase-like domain-containing protein [Acetobacterium paludosum]
MCEEEKKKKGWFSKAWKNYSNAFFLILIIGVTAIIIFTQVDLVEFQKTLKQTKGEFLLLGIGCVFLYWFLEAYMLLKLMRQENSNEKFSFAFTLTMVGQYYNLLDPSSSGGQPIQLYEMSKKKYGLGTGTAVLVQKYALYQITITFLAIIAIVFCTTELNQSLDAVKWLIAFGLVLNVAAIVFIGILVFNPNAARGILLSCVKILLKLRILKNSEKQCKKIDHFVGEYKLAVEGLKDKKKETLQLFFVSIIQMMAFYSVGYFVYLSLGLNSVNAVTIISLQAILYVAVAFVPTPGAVGGAEAGFLLIFGPIYGAVNAPVAMILWRMITFYFILVFGGVYLSIHSIKMGKEKVNAIGEELSGEVDYLIEENKKKQ